MRSMSVVLVAIASTWNAAHCAELGVGQPVGSNASAAMPTYVSIARDNPNSRDKLALAPDERVSGQVEASTQALDFTLHGPIPVPLDKPPPARRQPPPETICGMIEKAAREHEIPPRFLIRLIWQESRFRIAAVSHAGAQGIAQFMPATAAERDLKDPFDPKQALWAAAGLLSSLKQRFGNLGLAAAAYNAGPGRVSDWLGKKRRLPAETRNYVKAITGRPASSWAKSAKKTSLDIIVNDKPGAGCVSSVVAMAGDDSSQ